MGSDSFIQIPMDRFHLFADRVVLRDSSGASCKPALLELPGGRLAAARKFLILHEYSISKESAVRFLDVTRDSNPIHVESDIVPGAMTLSKTLMLLECLADGLSIDSVRAKFTGISYYGQRTLSHFFLSPGNSPGAVEALVNTYQAGRLISRVEISGSGQEPDRIEEPPRSATRAALGNEWLLRIFCESLNVDSAAYLRPDNGPSSFPRAFLASLPSGEMVRQFKGAGGMLNVLSLDFSRSSLPIAAETLPEVRLEKGRSGPMSFRRVVTRIIDGIRTYGKGFALVHAPSAGQPLPGA